MLAGTEKIYYIVNWMPIFDLETAVVWTKGNLGVAKEAAQASIQS